MTPVATKAKAIDGIIKWLIKSGKSPPPHTLYMPETGNHFKLTANNKIIIMPKKNDGTEIPIKTNKVIILSVNVYCLAAEMVPMIIPNKEHKTNAVPDNISVALNLSKISSMTGLLSA